VLIRVKQARTEPLKPAHASPELLTSWCEREGDPNNYPAVEEVGTGLDDSRN